MRGIHPYGYWYFVSPMDAPALAGWIAKTNLAENYDGSSLPIIDLTLTPNP